MVHTLIVRICVTVTQIRYNISMCISQTQKWTHMWSALCCFVTCQKNSMTNYILCLCLARVLKDTFYSSYHWFLVLITNSKVKKSISIKHGPALISFVYYAWYWSYSLDHLWKWSFPGQKSSYEMSFRFELCFCVPDLLSECPRIRWARTSHSCLQTLRASRGSASVG